MPTLSSPGILDRKAPSAWRSAAEQVGKAEYVIALKPGIRYQAHPCFAVRPDGSPRYRQIRPADLRGLTSPYQLPEAATRELRAEDFKVALTRLCDPRLASPVYSTLASFISGMAECSQLIREDILRLEEDARRDGRDVDSHPVLPDYRALPLAGIEVLDDQSFKIILSRKYPQLTYCCHAFLRPDSWKRSSSTRSRRHRRPPVLPKLANRHWRLPDGCLPSGRPHHPRTQS